VTMAVTEKVTGSGRDWTKPQLQAPTMPSRLPSRYHRRCSIQSSPAPDERGGQLPRTYDEATLHVVELVYGSVTDARALFQALTEHPGVPAPVASLAGSLSE
jgi:hypothetical protein